MAANVEFENRLSGAILGHALGETVYIKYKAKLQDISVVDKSNITCGVTTHNVTTHNVTTHNVTTHNVTTHNVTTHNVTTHNVTIDNTTGNTVRNANSTKDVKSDVTGHASDQKLIWGEATTQMLSAVSCLTAAGLSQLDKSDHRYSLHQLTPFAVACMESESAAPFFDSVACVCRDNERMAAWAYCYVLRLMMFLGSVDIKKAINAIYEYGKLNISLSAANDFVASISPHVGSKLQHIEAKLGRIDLDSHDASHIKRLAVALWACDESIADAGDFETIIRLVGMQGGCAEANCAVVGAILGAKYGKARLPLSMLSETVDGDVLKGRIMALMSRLDI